MLCHPNKIRQKDIYADFEKLDKELDIQMKVVNNIIKQMNSSKFRKEGIFKIPMSCSKHCRYWNECIKNVKSKQSKTFKVPREIK